MPYKLPIKITVILSIIILVFSLFLIYAVLFNVSPGFGDWIDIGGLTNIQFWGIIGLLCVFISWFLLFLIVE